MKIKIPEEVMNMLLPEFLIKELSDLEHCTEECRNCTGPRDAGGRLSDVCLHIQLIKAEATISKTVSQVFEFLNTQQLAQRKQNMIWQSMPDGLHKAFPELTLHLCNKLFEAWALYTAKYEDPIDDEKDDLDYIIVTDVETIRKLRECGVSGLANRTVAEAELWETEYKRKPGYAG